MKIKEFLAVINSSDYLNIVAHNLHWLYEGKAIYITPDLLERTIKLIGVIRNEFFITVED
nr:MAG TPA: hypothetical protein [Caudoviricetes sp.]